MIRIDLGQDQEFEVTIGGQAYTLREPTISEIDALSESDDPKQSTKAVHKLFTDLGLPPEVLAKLPMSKARKLMESLTTELTKKK